MIVAAVGFQIGKYLWPTEYIGRGGCSLHELWSGGGAQAYIGMTVPGFPNSFVLYGPNSLPISGGGTLPTWFETWSSYIAQAIVAVIERGFSKVEVRQDALENYNKILHETANQLIYITDGGSRDQNHYVNEWGKLQVNAPWEGEEYFRISSVPNLDHFILS